MAVETLSDLRSREPHPVDGRSAEAQSTSAAKQPSWLGHKIRHMEQETFDAHSKHTGCQRRVVTIERDAGPMWVDIWEPRQAPLVSPILLIHGWGGSGGYWRETANELSTTAQVIVPDLPGTGRSLPVSSAQDMFDQVNTLAELLDTLDIEQVQVVGHSMGGAMALLLADTCPDRVERLVLTSTCFFLNESQEQIYRAIMKFTYASMQIRPTWLASVPLVPQMMASRYFYRIPRDQRKLRNGLWDYLTLDLDTAIACANNACDPAIPEAGSRIQVPTLLIACRNDQVMPVGNVDYTVQVIPNSRAVWIDKCGHLPMVEKPNEYLDILEDFLEL